MLHTEHGLRKSTKIAGWSHFSMHSTHKLRTAVGISISLNYHGRPDLVCGSEVLQGIDSRNGTAEDGLKVRKGSLCSSIAPGHMLELEKQSFLRTCELLPAGLLSPIIHTLLRGTICSRPEA